MENVVLREICAERLEQAVAPYASRVAAVQCVSVHVDNATEFCDGARRAAADPVVAVVDAGIALEETPDAFLDMDAVLAASGVLAMKQTAGRAFPTPSDNADLSEIETSGTSSGDDRDASSDSAM
eukprot:1641989-Rhodomonas_salina.1